MPLDKDRYPRLGRLERLADFEEVLERVRSVWPDAHAEGSTGSERTFYVWIDGERELVAHGWSPKGLLESWRVRVLDPASEQGRLIH